MPSVEVNSNSITMRVLCLVLALVGLVWAAVPRPRQERGENVTTWATDPTTMTTTMTPSTTTTTTPTTTPEPLPCGIQQRSLRRNDVRRSVPKPTHARNGMLNTTLRWPEGRIPYEIQKANYTVIEFEMIKWALDEFTRLTNDCITFVHRDETHFNYVLIQSNDSERGCRSWIGMQGGAQYLELRSGECFYDKGGVILHELMHAVGFDHEHTRPDRDDYIVVHEENINPDYWSSFEKLDWTEASTYGEPYDFDSIMHYRKCDESKNGKETITPRDGKPREYGDMRTLSPSDMRKIKKMYGCSLGV